MEEANQKELTIMQIKASARQTALSTASYMKPSSQITAAASLVNQITEPSYNLLEEAEKIYQWLIKDLK